MNRTDVKEAVREKYSEAARRADKGSACCGASATLSGCSPITSNLYDSSQTGALPEQAVLASLGCGNPTALAQLAPGETVLDLGSGGGIDVLLSARRVGPTGKAYGLDMTDEMLALARENQRRAGLANVEFLKGEIEHIPLPDNSVDVIISNCVINLSGDKDQVLREAFRVLKPGGRFAVSDVVTRGDVPAQVREHMLLWVGCIAGALEDREYEDKLAKAGFRSISIEPTRVYHVEDAREFLTGKGVDVDALARRGRRQIHERVRARGEAGGCKLLRASLLQLKPQRDLYPQSAKWGKPLMPDHVFNVLFLCTGNSARSIMGESILRKDGAGRFRSFSAGSMPKGAVNPFALKVLASYGYPIDGLESKSWDVFAAPDAPRMDFVLTVCDDAAGETCPLWPGQPITAHWGIEDPARVEGPDIAKERAFVTAFKYLKNRIALFTSLPVASLNRLALTEKLRDIGKIEGSTSKNPKVA